MQAERAVAEKTSEGSIAEIIGRLVAKRAEIDKANAALKALRIEADNLERLAATSLEMAGVDGLRCHGKTWWTGIELHVSTVSANRDQLIEAAKRVDLDVVSVNTSRIKGWLLEEYERRRDAGTAGDRFAEGTPFDGIVSEYSERKLFHRSV
jgi:hypothetical protein